MDKADLTVRPLSRENARDLFAFFEGEAFVDHPAWAACYCNFVHFDHAASAWKLERPEYNKAETAARIDRGRMRGHIAFEGDRPVSWVNAGPSAFFAGGNFSVADADAATLGNIICFVVAPRWRRKGVAGLLLDAACAGLRSQGMTIAQANPREEARDDGDNHFGPLSMFLHAGFKVHHHDESDGSLYVRKAL
jgi:GNAT superfamily N-acetyltransferase